MEFSHFFCPVFIECKKAVVSVIFLRSIGNPITERAAATEVTLVIIDDLFSVKFNIVPVHD